MQRSPLTSALCIWFLGTVLLLSTLAFSGWRYWRGPYDRLEHSRRRSTSLGVSRIKMSARFTDRSRKEALPRCGKAVSSGCAEREGFTEAHCRAGALEIFKDSRGVRCNQQRPIAPLKNARKGTASKCFAMSALLLSIEIELCKLKRVIPIWFGGGRFQRN